MSIISFIIYFLGGGLLGCWLMKYLIVDINNKYRREGEPTKPLENEDYRFIAMIGFMSGVITTLLGWAVFIFAGIFAACWLLRNPFKKFIDWLP